MIAAAVVAGAVGGFVGRFTAPVAAASPRSTAISAEPSRDDGDELTERLEKVERHLRVVERQQLQAKAEAAPGADRATNDDAPAPKAAAADPAFQAAVRDAMEAINDERRSARQERTTQRLTAKLGLSDAQSDKIAAIAQELWQGLRDLRDADNGDPSGDKAQDLRTKSEAHVAAVLDPSQRAKYEALDDGEKISAGRRRPF